MKKTNAERLRALMKQHSLTRPAIADLAGRTVKAVDTWLAPEGASSHKPMPGHALELIELKLERRK